MEMWISGPKISKKVHLGKAFSKSYESPKMATEIEFLAFFLKFDHTF